MEVRDQSEELQTVNKAVSIVVNADGISHMEQSHIVNEHFLDLFINEKLAARLVCTPDCLIEFVVGRLISGGYIQSIDEVEVVYLCNSANRSKVFLKQDVKLLETREQEPTCCTGNQVFLKNPEYRNLNRLEKSEWRPEWIFGLANAFVSDTSIHRITQGTHSCYLSVEGDIVFRCEDIGRHNAMDKAIGYAALKRYQRGKCILYTTGRIATDMVKKAVVSGIAVMVSKSVPTDAAIEMAKYYNLTLICKAWPDKFEIFHNAD